ncbi:MAG: carboxylating nicotinate-nucleotide diphosphorylase [Halothiobacillaceae bacterium]|jgi:nicotinate-nucleotide pyrophosphorylase (carboxylating)|nr:carboxylating nicotinate-nucleotide diphosphorylase [Halothiobacillaceae bacterium]MDY0049793.1 carboxylating nicotinate-nucleotide diphosphorylase [Halothiobacillaceae bacterium]
MPSQPLAPPPALDIVNRDVERALAEDIGSGDASADLIPEDRRLQARVIAREDAVVAGRPWFDTVFARMDPRIVIDWRVGEGERIQADQTLCTLHGPARALLSGERSALNFLQTLSATATLTRRYVDVLDGLPTRLLDTRKTLPGLRHAQKYAVRCGGGHNHRIGLYDAILIKENHIAAAGGITPAVNAARERHPGLFLEVEVETLKQLEECLELNVSRVLLDNFDLPRLHQAVALAGGRVSLEASGGITLAHLRAVAETGVDFISIGALTKDIKAIDLSMRFIPG